MEWRWRLKPLSKKKRRKNLSGSDQFVARFLYVRKIKLFVRMDKLGREYRIAVSLRDSKDKFWRKCLSNPPSHGLLRKKEKKKKKNLYWRSNLEIFFPFSIALMEVLRIFTSHLWRQTFSSLRTTSLRAISTYNCIVQSIRKTSSESHIRRTEEAIYSLRNTSVTCYYSSFPPSQCGWWNTGSLHSKYWSSPFKTCSYCWRKPWKEASYTKLTAGIRLPLLLWVRVVQLCIYIFGAIFEVLASTSKNNDNRTSEAEVQPNCGDVSLCFSTMEVNRVWDIGNWFWRTQQQNLFPKKCLCYSR